MYNIAYTDHLTVTILYWARSARCGEVSWNLSKTAERWEVFEYFRTLEQVLQQNKIVIKNDSSEYNGKTSNMQNVPSGVQAWFHEKSKSNAGVLVLHAVHSLNLVLQPWCIMSMLSISLQYQSVIYIYVFFYVLLTVHLSIILVTAQFNALILVL